MRSEVMSESVKIKLNAAHSHSDRIQRVTSPASLRSLVSRPKEEIDKRKEKKKMNQLDGLISQ
ncbi:hypothetical protein E2C01_009362 [Portunus trituberculatus]|uniref:Uncharacterized protein n=1 Tax=Portunus trituberculatus TaxID=210409 RepID=A0A5B7D500_PORTR|nr:hypothetical protein [Portunus trituberculatus]